MNIYALSNLDQPIEPKIDIATQIRLRSATSFSIADAAAYLAVSRETVESLIHSQNLRVRKVEGRLLIHRESIEELLA